MNNLIWWAQSHVQEARNRHCRDKVAVAKRIARIVDAFKRVRGQVQMFLGSDNVHVFAVVYRLANKRHILQRKKCQFPLYDSVWTAKSVLRLPIEGSLTEDWSHKAALIKILSDFSKNLKLGLSRTAYDDDVRAGNHILGVLRHFVDVADQVTLALPAGELSVGFNLVWPSFGSAR